MFKTYEEALAWIHTRRGMGPKPGIRRMEWMMEKLNHPQQKFKSIHIAGTNGKGSTVAYLTALFQAHDYSVGSFTSPHIMKFNERISVNGQPIADEDILALANRIQPLYDEIAQTELGGLTEFEVITSMMFLYFSEVQPDVVLLEVGLGGLFDSTNVVTPNLSLITTIGLDHIKILGNTIEAIAFQKAGIIKKDVPVVLGNIGPAAKSVLLDIANQQHSEVAEYHVDFHAQSKPSVDIFHERFDYQTDDCLIKDITISLMGQHQVDNATTALHAFRVFCRQNEFAYDEESIKLGFERAFWPVRMEVVSHSPLTILDGAHNEPAMEALVNALETHFPNRRLHILYASLTTKELDKIGEWLNKLPQASIHLTTFDFDQVASIEELKKGLGIEAVGEHENWQEAIQTISKAVDEQDIFLITGSLYFLSEVRHFLLEK
jgi:dihydrofolate synthase / folylpolyglutamate synthase